ncbi:hypothetical protein ACFFV7_43130 [Nonomuraea spiralis]|uniref:Uncharacterized protein n=1 Tax=Nonomuraea spiralis TaxID=46182 RepID=A0ABV5IU10_9ACTN|nr:hypothetical protein [Nonomuraea spiralis]
MVEISSVQGEAQGRRSPVGRVLMAVARRWPTWLGLAFMGFTVLDLKDGRDAALVVFLAALIYLATAVTGRPGVVWPMFGASVVAVLVLRLLDLDPWPGLVGGAVCVAAVGLGGGLLHTPWLGAVQVPAMLVFGAASVAALSLSPALGGCLVAAALIGHATLDVIVWRRNKVVARSLAEFCAALDLPLGVAVLVLTFTA